MRRSLLVVLVVAGVLAAALGLVTNYASEVVPAFFAADLLRVWVVFGLLVLAGIVVALIGARLTDSPLSSPSAVAAVPAYGTGVDSTRVPTLSTPWVSIGRPSNCTAARSLPVSASSVPIIPTR